MPITRPATPEDQAFLFELYCSTRQEEMAAWGWSAAQQEPFLRMQFTAQQRSYELSYPEADHRIILLDNVRIGRILVARNGEEILLVDIALLPDYRGSGIGTALIRELLDEAAETSRPVRLQVYRNNPAQRLYQRLGFYKIGENEIYYDMEWRANIPVRQLEPSSFSRPQ